VTGAATANFYYDADGKQIKATVNGVTTYYVGNHYEVKNSVVTKYYFAGATRLAVRTGGTLSYLLGDHLGSSSVTTDANGVKTASALYKAFGETRYTLGNLNTDYHFTGQREEAALGGIYWFQSRWFDPTLGRFMSPDTIVPTSTQGTQAWDRYAFVNNNPVRYTDPTGHGIEGDDPPPSDDPCIKYGQSSPECQAATPPTSTPTPPATPTASSTPVQSSTSTVTPTPQACVTPQPGASPCQPSGQTDPGITIGWDSSRVDWAEVGLDVAGIGADLFPLLQPTSTSLELVHAINNWSNVTQVLLDANQAVFSKDIDWIDIGLDTVSVIPEVGIIPSGISLLYHLSAGLYFKSP
jgi:RHS repeat-associated protein